ncbi:MAG TPA: RsmD family RNA methyltransferase [Longimicrobium sp.]|jgi:16S rRNA (guanine966-N2)-methyltransferase
MRIIRGKWAGRHLTSPSDRRVRPTAEALRDVWLEMVEPELKDARVIDLFAGTGALGLEAMSRGARSADFVESRPASLHALKANVAALRVRDRTRIFKKDALPFATALEAGTYHVAFADPPYESRMLDRLIDIWMEVPFAATLGVEHAADHPLPRGDDRYYHEDSAVTLYRADPALLRGTRVGDPLDE